MGMSKFVLPAALAASFLAADGAIAKPARCFTTDDGHFPCEFRGLDAAVSFQISALGLPTYSLWVERPGVAAGFVGLGDRNVALPGMYLRRQDDPACWENDATQARICAW